jgi:hypothetical protein
MLLSVFTLFPPIVFLVVHPPWFHAFTRFIYAVYKCLIIMVLIDKLLDRFHNSGDESVPKGALDDVVCISVCCSLYSKVVQRSGRLQRLASSTTEKSSF